MPELSLLDAAPRGQRARMTRADMAARYGADPAAQARIRLWARAHDLVITREETISARLGLGGTAAALSEAFGVELFDYDHPELGEFHARSGLVRLPAVLADDVTGVFGFCNHRIPRRARRVMRPGVRPWFLPSDLGQVFSVSSAHASGQSIGLLEFGDGGRTADVAAYFGKLGLSTPPIQVVSIDGASSPRDPAGEVVLDVRAARALSAGAKVVVYFSSCDEKGMIDVLSAVIADGVNDPSVISIRCGQPENEALSSAANWSPAAVEHIRESFQAVAQLGVDICVSTRDNGIEAQITDGRARVLSFPAPGPAPHRRPIRTAAPRPVALRRGS